MCPPSRPSASYGAWATSKKLFKSKIEKSDRHHPGRHRAHIIQPWYIVSISM